MRSKAARAWFAKRPDQQNHTKRDGAGEHTGREIHNIGSFSSVHRRDLPERSSRTREVAEISAVVCPSTKIRVKIVPRPGQGRFGSRRAYDERGQRREAETANRKRSDQSRQGLRA